MLYLLSIFLLTCAFNSGNAQQNIEHSNYNEKAIDILSEARRKLNTYDALLINFSFSASEALFDMDDDMDGFMYLKGDKFYIKSGHNHFLSDGTLAWTYLESVNEVHISNLEDSETVITPNSLLENFTETFNSLWIRKESENGHGQHIIDMVYIEPLTFQKYRIAVEESTGFLKYISAYDLQGNTYTYYITSTEINPEIPEGLFTFEPGNHPGIEVVDLR